MRWFITGGAGFIGSNFVRLVLQERPDVHVVNYDALTYAGNLENLADLSDDPRYTFVRGRIQDPAAVREALADGVDVIVNFAAESHVDRSIVGAMPFIETNVMGTQVLLDAARQAGVPRFVHVSTDEVYGSLGDDGYFTESTPLAPNSPYSASKASSDLLVRAAWHTHGYETVITRCSNNYGPYQFPEKLIPLMISNAMDDKPLPVYGQGTNVRDWIHVEDHCRGILAIVERGRAGEVYNLGGRSERSNIDVVREILRQVGKPESLIRFVKDRPGHDLRYAIDCTKAETELGWIRKWTFEDGLAQTINWYQEHTDWWRRVRDGSYQEFYDKWYGDR
ncbi:MAG: dTDP-glucose 4,6-dehydratase [Planctomycetes bacterium]|nr:dTDP-glucose 4,6-dehydratase [Planctomycetota bacterium]